MQEVLRVAVELIDQDLDEVAGGIFQFNDGGSTSNFTINNQDSNQGVQFAGQFANNDFDFFVV